MSHYEKDGAMARVFTVREMTAVLAFVAVLQTIGGKFVIDSYIDSRIRFHNADPKAHDGTIAQSARDGDITHHQLEELGRKLDDTNQRLSRIEGALARK